MTLPLRLTWGGGATWILEAGDLVIGCDPVLCAKGTVQDYGWFRSRRIEEPTLGPTDLARVNLWLLTHGHLDHLDALGLTAISPLAEVVCDRSAGRRLGKRPAEVLGWSDSRSLEIAGTPVRIEAVPAIHARPRLFGRLVGNGNGYLLTLWPGADEARVYVTGDAVLDRRLRATVGRFRPQVIIANAGGAHVGRGWLGRVLGRITLDHSDLAELATLAPGAVIVPVHHGTFSHYLDATPPEGPGILTLTPGSAVDVPVGSRQGVP